MSNQQADPMGLYVTDNNLNFLLRMLTEIVQGFGSRMTPVDRIALQLRYHNFAMHAMDGNWTDARSEYETYMLPLIEQRIKIRREVGDEFPAKSHALLHDFADKLRAVHEANWASLDDVINSTDWKIGMQGLKNIIDEFEKQGMNAKLRDAQIVRGFRCVEMMFQDLDKVKPHNLDASDDDEASTGETDTIAGYDREKWAGNFGMGRMGVHSNDRS